MEYDAITVHNIIVIAHCTALAAASARSIPNHTGSNGTDSTPEPVSLIRGMSHPSGLTRGLTVFLKDFLFFSPRFSLALEFHLL